MPPRSFLLVALLSLPLGLLAACSSTVDPSANGSHDASDSTPDVDPTPESCTLIETMNITASFPGPFGGQCLSEAPIPSAVGSGCVTIVGWEPEEGVACSCDATVGRHDVAASSADALNAAKNDPSATGSTCFCELAELVGGAASKCENDELGEQPRSGFCYVDETIGSADVVKDCPTEEKHLIRVVGAATTLPPGTASENFTFTCKVACK